MIGNSNDKTNFSHKLLLTNTQVSKICKAFETVSSANIKISKTQLSKTAQSGGFIADPCDFALAPIKGINSLLDSSAKEKKNMGAKK